MRRSLIPLWRGLTAITYVGLWLMQGLQVIDVNVLNTLPLALLIVVPGLVVGMVWGSWVALLLALSMGFIALAPCGPEGSCHNSLAGELVVIAVAATTIAIGVGLRRLVGRIAL